MKGKNKLIILYALFISFILWELSYYHEVVHQLIFELYGVRSKIKPTWYGWVTVGNEEDMKKLSEQEYMEMSKLHILNEIVNYNMMIFLGVSIFMGCVIMIELIELRATIKEISVSQRKLENS